MEVSNAKMYERKTLVILQTLFYMQWLLINTTTHGIKSSCFIAAAGCTLLSIGGNAGRYIPTNCLPQKTVLKFTKSQAQHAAEPLQWSPRRPPRPRVIRSGVQLISRPSPEAHHSTFGEPLGRTVAIARPSTNAYKIGKITKHSTKMPPASAVNNSNAAAQAAKAERAEKLRGALKGFIVADRQRRQEEFETQCEEQRLRREREEVERQNQAALDDTRGQITRLDEQLADLHSQKHQLTVQVSAASGPVFLPPLRLQHQHHPLMRPDHTAGRAAGRSAQSEAPAHRPAEEGSQRGWNTEEDGQGERAVRHPAGGGQCGEWPGLPAAPSPPTPAPSADAKGLLWVVLGFRF